MYLIRPDSSRERIVYIEYRAKKTVRAVTISELGVVTSWVFTVFKAGLARPLLKYRPSCTFASIKQIPATKIQKSTTDATYWMVPDASFTSGLKPPTRKNRITRVENPHWMISIFGERTKNPFQAAEEKIKNKKND